MNDTHAFLAGIDGQMNACFEATDCRGGLARISAAIQTARQEQDNVIALDAGDQFQGTLFYSVNKWPMIAAADALLPYDAMTLGNHEFDEGCDELARFLEAQPLPVLAANLTPQQGCPLA
ncbi:MAG: metallophosphoesterase, partial [Desulfovibrio sp.]|uniref:metallophosphoesterase n=1 Tax=Desulfovibrio sp. TaxID=885 RepID=UPI002A90CD28